MRRPGPRALGIVGVCLALLAAALVVGVHATRWRGSVTLLANWTGDDEKHFSDLVIRHFERDYHIRVVYQGSSAESQVLAADAESGTPPDVVILPGPGELADYARRGQLQPLDGLVDPRAFAAIWSPALSGPDGKAHSYWVPVKVDLKSIVWYPSRLRPDQLASTAASTAAWCLGMGSGATSGWPGTDWIADILLQQAGPRVYQQWATGELSWRDPRVVRAWTTWGQLVGAGSTATARRALTTDYPDASAGVAASPPTCALEHQASFVRTSAAWRKAHGEYVHSSALIPGADPGSRAWQVSGDLAAMLRDTPQARALVRYLASVPAQRDWYTGTAQSGFSANKQMPSSVYSGDPTAAGIARTLSDPAAVHCWDASDAMPRAMRDAFYQAVLHYLALPRDLDQQLATLDAVRSLTTASNTPSRTAAAWLPSVCETASHS